MTMTSPTEWLAQSRDGLRDQLLVTLWLIVTFKQFPNDELLLYPLALYFSWAFVRDLPLLFPLIKRAWVLFLFPIWLFLSVSWGVETETILKNAAQLLLTIMICFYASLRLSRRQIMLAMVIAGTIFGILSFLAPLSGGLAQRGVFSSKNAMGSAMVILLVSALCVVLDRGFPRMIRLGAAAAALLAFDLIFVAHSATAVILSAGAIMAIFLFGILPQGGRLRSPIFWVFTLAGISFVLTFMATVLAFQEVNPIEEVLAIFDKDTTLTGRTTLWAYATEQIRLHPYLGVGDGGFWTPLDWTSDARRIYEEFHKKYYAHFSFHNSYFEIAVHQGLIGLGIAVLAVSWSLFQVIRAVLVRNAIPTVFFFTISSVTMVRSMTEAGLMAPFSQLPMLLTIGALLALRDRLSEPVYRAPPPVFRPRTVAAE